MTYGIIDVGSNTVRLCIYEVKDGKVKALFNNKTTAGLIGYVNDGELTQKGIKKACDVLGEYRDMADHADIKDLFVFATASLRNISNTSEAVKAIHESTGLNVDVLTGHEEATLDFNGAANAMALDEGVMIDIGGGSTEVLVYERGEIQDAASLPLGSLSLFKNHVSNLFPQKKEDDEIRKEVKSELKKIKFLKNRRFHTLLGIGGTIRAVRKMHNDYFEFPRQNDRMKANTVSLLLKELDSESNNTLKNILDVAPDRVHTLIPGMLVLDTICRSVECDEILVSNYGVREGYLYKKAILRE